MGRRACPRASDRIRLRLRCGAGLGLAADAGDPNACVRRRAVRDLPRSWGMVRSPPRLGFLGQVCGGTGASGRSRNRTRRP